MLESFSDWDSYLTIDLDRVGLPYKSFSVFILNEDFHKLVLASKQPCPGKFVDQSIAFCKAFCKLFLGHEIIKSNLVKGLSAFDSSVMIEGSEEHYSVAFEKLSAYFSNAGWISASDKVKITSPYRSFITKLRADPVLDYDNWVPFLSSHFEIRCRPELFQLYKYSCLCLPPIIEMPPAFIVPVPSLENNTESFQSCLRSLQVSYLTVPHVKGNSPRRVNLLGKLETGYRNAVLRTERPLITSSSTTPSVSRHSSGNSLPSPDPSLSRVNLEVLRCSDLETEDASKKMKCKSGKGKKTK